MSYEFPEEFKDDKKLSFNSYAKSFIKNGGVTYGIEEKEILVPHEDNTAAMADLIHMALSDLADNIPVISLRREAYKFTKERDGFYHKIKVVYQTYQVS